MNFDDVLISPVTGLPLWNGSIVESAQDTGEYSRRSPEYNVMEPSGTIYARNNNRFDQPNYYKGIGAGDGYEFTGGFLERTTGQAGVSDTGDDFLYTQEMADSGIWKRFGFDATQQLSTDVPYWSQPAPKPTAGIGLFGGAYLPEGVSNVFDFDYSDATFSPSGVTGEGENYSAANGSFDFGQVKPGTFLQVRFDFNATPQINNTTVETALIWQTRDANNVPTYSFALAGQPITFGTDTVANTYLNRPVLTAYFASNEDVNARALLAIRSNNPIKIQPLTTLCVINK